MPADIIASQYIGSHYSHCDFFLVSVPQDGSAALHYAVARGHLPIVRILLDQGADVHALDGVSETPVIETAVAPLSLYRSRPMMYLCTSPDCPLTQRLRRTTPHCTMESIGVTTRSLSCC